MSHLQLSVAGFALVCNALTERRRIELLGLHQALNTCGPGARNLLDQAWCQELAQETRVSPRLEPFIPRHFRAIQCSYFEKGISNNWLVPIHQDLSVPVRERASEPGWGPWTDKERACFVQPPVDVLNTLIAVRLHLDPCTAEDGPLRVVPGTHRQGVIPPEHAVALRAHEQICTAQAGDALVLKPLLLHRSGKATGTSRRRVLHLLFAPPSPGGLLRWRHAV